MCDDVFLIMKYLSTIATAEQLKKLLLQHLHFRTDFVFHLSLYVRCNTLSGVQSCVYVLFEPKVLRFFALRSFWLLNPLSPELNPICYLLALLAHDFLHVSRIRVKSLTLRLLLSYVYICIYIWH
jgi:transposase